MSDSTQISSDFFFAGGALRPSAQSYVRRPADDELYEHLLAGDFCFVLTPRQMGKTSLIASTSRRLEKQGIRNRMVDLTSIGTEVTAEQWYLGILNQVSKGLHLTVDPGVWWQVRAAYSNIQRFSDFMIEQVVGTLPDRVVIFFDEIDSTLSFNWRDDFFAGIRALYNARTVNPALERLTFALFGVASPADLIKDNTRTPFNIGYGIQLNEFSWEDSSVLRAGLEGIFPGLGERIFRRIYGWTNGHPYLTQKLCLMIAEEPAFPWTDEQIDQKVYSLFLAEDASKESNLNFIQQRLLNHPRKTELLRIYGQVISGQTVRDEGQSILHNDLKLYGIVTAKNGILKPRNKIYENVFTRKWVHNNLPTPWGAIATATSVGLVVLILAGLIYNAVILPNQKQDAISNFYRATTAEKRVQALARLFSLHGFILPISYESDALDMFYKLPYSEQTALFSTEEPVPPEYCRDQLEVISNLYGTLALVDVQQEEKNNQFLHTMSNSLNACTDQQKDDLQKATQLQSEIDHWLTARKAVDQPDFNSAINEYNQAIHLNGKNRATSFELARAYTVKGDYKQALDILEALLAKVPANAIVPTSQPNGSQTATSHQTFTTAPTRPDVTLTTLTSGFTSTPTVAAETPTPGSTAGVTPSPPGENTPPAVVPTTTPELPANPAAISGFASDADLIYAATRLVESSGFQAYLLKTPLTGSYTALHRFGILKDTSATPTLTNRQEVQRQVNQALLQATVIRATYQVVHFGNGVEAATATAFDQEYRGNLATIEALRPTANTQRITFLEQAIQPTLESEATLFAQASTASAAMNIAVQSNPKTTATPSGLANTPVQTISTIVPPRILLTPVNLTPGTGTLQAKPQPTQTPQTTANWIYCVAFSLDSKYVVSGGANNTAWVWEISSGKKIAQMIYDSWVTSANFSPDGKYVVSGSADKTARVWEANTGKEIARMTHDDQVLSVAFSPDGKYVVSGSADDTARLWEASTGKEIARMTHSGAVNSVAFSPDAKLVVSGSDDSTVRVWEVSTGKEVARMTHSGGVNSVIFSPDGKYVVSGSSDHTARVWDAITGKEVARMTHDNDVYSVAFSSDAKYVVSGSADDTARVWDAITGKEVARMIHAGIVYSVAFSPDGKYVVSGSADDTARLWEASTGKEIARMTHDGLVHAVAFSPDEKFVVSGSSDNTTRVWDVKTGKELARLVGSK